MWPEALVTLRSVLFRNISVVAKDFFPSIEAVTISLHPGAGLLLQVCSSARRVIPAHVSGHTNSLERGAGDRGGYRIGNVQTPQCST